MSSSSLKPTIKRTDPEFWFLKDNETVEKGERAWTPGNKVSALIDGDEYYSELAKQLEKLKKGDRFYLAGWRVSSRVYLQPTGHTDPNLKLTKLLGDIISKKIIVRSMVWDGTVNLQFGGHGKESADFVWKINRFINKIKGLEGRAITDGHLTGFVSSHHQKFTILERAKNSVAYVGGIDLSLERWDTPEHNSDNRRQKEKLDGWHDVHCEVYGPAVRQIWFNFKQRWNDYKRRPPIIRGKIKGAFIEGDASHGNHNVQLLRTLACRRTYSFASKGEQTIKNAYIKAIKNAEHYIYIEDQYLWPCEIVDALGLAVNNKKNLKVIIMLARDFDLGATLAAVHEEMRACAINSIKGKSKDKVFLYYLEQSGQKGNNAVFVHSKIMIVDDCYAAIGSANINNRSSTADSELQLGVVDGTTAESKMDGAVVEVCEFAKKLRTKLWGEHLGMSETDLEDPIAALDLTTGVWPTNGAKKHHTVHYAPPKKKPNFGNISDWFKILVIILKASKKQNLDPESEKLKEVIKILFELLTNVKAKDFLTPTPPIILPLLPLLPGIRKEFKEVFKKVLKLVLNPEIKCPTGNKTQTNTQIDKLLKQVNEMKSKITNNSV